MRFLHSFLLHKINPNVSFYEKIFNKTRRTMRVKDEAFLFADDESLIIWQHVNRPPAFPVSLLSSWLPAPRSSVFSCTLEENVEMKYWNSKPRRREKRRTCVT